MSNKSKFNALEKAERIKKRYPLRIRKDVAYMYRFLRIEPHDIVESINSKYKLRGKECLVLWAIPLIAKEFYGNNNNGWSMKKLVDDTQPIGDNTQYVVLKYRCHPDVYSMFEESKIPHSDFINRIMLWYKERVFDKDKEKQKKEQKEENAEFLPKYFV